MPKTKRSQSAVPKVPSEEDGPWTDRLNLTEVLQEPAPPPPIAPSASKVETPAPLLIRALQAEARAAHMELVAKLLEREVFRLESEKKLGQFDAELVRLKALAEEAKGELGQHAREGNLPG